MDAFFRDLVAEHNLRTIGINLFGAPSAHFGVYLHWNVGDGTECCAGSGKTVDEALTAALREMAERRQPASEAA